MTIEIRILPEQENSVCLVPQSRQLDIRHREPLRQAIENGLKQGSRVDLDLGQVQFLDSCVVALFAQINRSETGGRFCLKGLSQRLLLLLSRIPGILRSEVVA